MISKIADRIAINLDDLTTRYDRLQLIKRLVEGLSDEKLLALDFAVEMIPQPKRTRPVVVCLCGSTRFMEAYQEANLKETLAGRIVLSIGCNTKDDSMLELSQGVKNRLDELHKRKIDMADEIFVLNVGGYIGQSTKDEIAYAREQGKRVRYLEDR
jgi:hypothetical protein